MAIDILQFNHTQKLLFKHTWEKSQTFYTCIFMHMQQTTFENVVAKEVIMSNSSFCQNVKLYSIIFLSFKEGNFHNHHLDFKKMASLSQTLQPLHNGRILKDDNINLFLLADVI